MKETIRFIPLQRLLPPALAKRVLLLATLAAILGTVSADAGLRIYYIRHAEGGHNVTRDWEDVPKDERPDYVGDPDQFTPLGETQLEAVSPLLQELEYRFDFIASSPLWRSRNTILPYLRETGSTGEVWPELAERSASSSDFFSPDLPEITDPILGAGSPITLPDDETAHFSLRADGDRNFKIPDYGRDELRETAASKLVLQAAIDTILDRFGGTDSAILLAGHGASGKTLIRMLTQDIDADSIENTGIWMVEEQSDGTFKRMIYNSKSLRRAIGENSTTVRFSDLRADLSDGEIDGESARDSDVTLTKAADGLDVIYSLSIASQDFDGVGDSNDSLSWDIRFRGYTGGDVRLDGNDASVTLGSPAQAHMSDDYFGVSDERYLEKGDSIQFTIENVDLKAASNTTVQFDGFDGLYGSDDAYVFGVGSVGLESQVTEDDGDFTFSPKTTLTISCPDDKFRVRDLTGSFTISGGSRAGFLRSWTRLSPAESGEDYRNHLVDLAFGESLSFSKVGGPEWLTVANDGALAGSPDEEHAGPNVFKVRLENAEGRTNTMTVVIEVDQP